MQVRDPLNPNKTISVTEPTEALCLARVEHYRRMRGDLRHGAARPEDIAEKLRVQDALSVKEVWEDYLNSFPEHRKRAMEGTWKRHFACWEGLTIYELSATKMTEWERWEGTRTFVRGGKRLRGMGVRTVKTLFAQLRAAVRRRIKAREMRETPWGDWHPSGDWGRVREEREALRSIDEVAALLHVARQADEQARERGRFSDLYARICVLVFTGLRQGELGALGWDDLEEVGRDDAARVVVMGVRHQVKAKWKEDHPNWKRPSYPPKAGSAGTLRLHGDVVRALDEQRGYLRARGMYRVDGPIFPDSKTGTWRLDETVLKPERLRELAARAGIAADLERLVPHGLRHTMASLEAMASQDLKATAQRTRHKDLTVLLQYMHQGGRGLAASPLPSAGVGPPAVAELLPAPPPVHLITGERGAELAEEENDALALRQVLDPERRGGVPVMGDVSGLEQAYHRWVHAGRPGVRPAEVTEGAERARSRAYISALRRARDAGESDTRAASLAQAAGMRGKHSYLGAWGKIARRLGEPIPIRNVVRGQRREKGPEPPFQADEETVAMILPFRRRVPA